MDIDDYIAPDPYPALFMATGIGSVHIFKQEGDMWHSLGSMYHQETDDPEEVRVRSHARHAYTVPSVDDALDYFQSLGPGQYMKSFQGPRAHLKPVNVTEIYKVVFDPEVA